MVLTALSRTEGLAALSEYELFAPPLLWPEVRSALHVAVIRGLVTRDAALASMAELDSGAVKERRHRQLGARAWTIADRFGWSKTYDAEYLALAALLRARLLTFDRRVRRAADHLGLLAEMNHR